MNVAWIESKAQLTRAQVDADLRAILEQRFGRMMLLYRSSTLHAGELGSWRALYPARPIFGGAVVLRRGGHRLVFQAEFDNDWSAWCRHVMCSEAGALYRAECGEDGIEGTWAPDPKRWPRFEDFVRSVYRRASEQDIRLRIESVPNPLLGDMRHEDRQADADGELRTRRGYDHRDAHEERDAANRVASIRR